MTITLGHYLAVGAILFTLGIFGIFINRKNVIVILMSIELILLAVNVNLVAFSANLHDLVGQVFALLVLTVGIAVDSNVLIYERIREEVRAGRTPINAIDAGFTRALATILDSNITTFIAAAVLFYIGTGPVRGFAVTLGIGIITTVFTAFTLTRLIVATWVRWRRPQRVPI